MVFVKVAEGEYLFPRRVRRTGPDTAVCIGGNSEVIEVAGADVAAMLAGLEVAAVKPCRVTRLACVEDEGAAPGKAAAPPVAEAPFLGELAGY